MSGTDSITHYAYVPLRTGVRGAFPLPPKAPHTLRIYVVDFTALLASLGQPQIAGAAVDAQPPLTVHGGGFTASTVTVRLGGGATTPQPFRMLTIALFFADGTREDVGLPQPIIPALPDIADGAVTIDAMPVTVAGQPVELTSLQPLPGGQALGDMALAMRGNVLGLIPAATGGGGGGSAGEVAFIQAQPSASWLIAHGLGTHPQPRVVTTSGDLVEGDVSYVDSNTLLVSFSAPFAGKAYL